MNRDWTAQITTFPFGKDNKEPLEILQDSGFIIKESPHGRKHTEAETKNLLGDIDTLIAGTEPLSADTLQKGLPKLKHISRVGIGFDGLDLDFCKKNNIKVTYTPDAPTRSVVEQTIGLMICMVRKFIESHEDMRKGKWSRLTGLLLEGETLGLLGCGRIGKQVATIAKNAFGMKVLANDINEDETFTDCEFVSFDELIKKSKILSLHVPLTDKTKYIISSNELKLMQKESYIINTCRGKVIEENALYKNLENNHIAGAAIDVFEKEPYNGILLQAKRIILCAHQGSCSTKGRYDMEITAAKNAINFKDGKEINADYIL